MAGVRDIRIGQIGHKFIGKAHAYAYSNVGFFFDLPVRPVRQTLCGIGDDLDATAKRWGFSASTQDWHDLVNDPEIDVIDICAPSSIHREIAIEAARQGKHIFCEKPLAMNLEDAREMLAAVRKAKVKHTIGFNYRKVPAIGLAKQLIEEGEIGRIFHFRGIYSQDWLVNENFPRAWRLRRDAAGGGSSWDLGAHVVDLARYLIGEIDEVVVNQETFVKNRPVAVSEDGLVAVAGSTLGAVDVDDATTVLTRFANGSMGIIEATRYGTGHRNQNFIEVSGSKGAIVWRGFEKMSDLEFYSVSDPSGAQGFRSIHVGEGQHPYVGAYWPSGHVIGFGDTFTHEVLDFLNSISSNKESDPTFVDGLRCQEVLTAFDESAATHAWAKVRRQPV